MSLFSKKKKNVNNDATVDQFIMALKRIFNDDKKNIAVDGYFEWNINNWNSLKNEENSPEYIVGGYRWKIQLFPNGTESNENYVGIYLKNIDVENNERIHICANFILYIHNQKYVSSYNAGQSSTHRFFNNSFNAKGFSNFIEKSNLTVVNEEYLYPLVDNGRTTVGAYIIIYKYKREQYLDELKYFVINNNRRVFDEDYYEWEIKNWSKVPNEQESAEFEACGYKWKIDLFPNGKSNENINNVSIYLKNRNVILKNISSLNTNFIFVFRNHNDYSCFVSKPSSSITVFKKDNNNIGYGKFIIINELFTHKKNKRN